MLHLETIRNVTNPLLHLETIRNVINPLLHLEKIRALELWKKTTTFEVGLNVTTISVSYSLNYLAER